MTNNSLPSPKERRGFYGQETAQKAFLDALQTHHVHHAWMLYGGYGVGKASFAYHVTRAFLRLGNEDVTLMSDHAAQIFQATEQDAVHQALAQGEHPHVQTLERIFDSVTGKYKTRIGIDQVRALKSFFHHTPHGNGYRICVIDSADMLTEEAANALLKILEEPPPQTLFFVIVQQARTVLPTIRSRCRLLSFAPLPDHHIRTILGQNSFSPFSFGSAGYAAALSHSAFESIIHALQTALDQGKPLATIFPTEALLAIEGEIALQTQMYELMRLVFTGSVRGKMICPETALVIKSLYALLWHKLIQYFDESIALNLNVFSSIMGAVALIDGVLQERYQYVISR